MSIVVVSVSPCKCNIMYAFTQFKSNGDTFLPVVERLHRERQQCPRVIIYCQQFEDCEDLYLFFRSYRGIQYTQPAGAPDLPSFRLVDMYMSCTDPDVKEMIISAFTKESCLCT